MEVRRREILICGVNGFTAQKLLEYIVINRPDMTLGVTCREETKLHMTITEIETKCKKSLLNVEKHVTGIDNIKKLARIFEGYKLVINCIGPFAKTGLSVVEACIQARTHYVDCTGEPGFIEESMEVFQERAKKNGVMIVHACGFDSLPLDIGINYTVNEIAKKEGTASYAESYMHLINSRINLGTFKTIISSLDTLKNRKKHARSVRSDRNDKTSTKDTTDRSDKTSTKDTTDRSDKTSTKDTTDTTDKTSTNNMHTDRSDKTDTNDTNDKTDTNDRSDKTDINDKTDMHTDRSDNTDTNDTNDTTDMHTDKPVTKRTVRKMPFYSSEIGMYAVIFPGSDAYVLRKTRSILGRDYPPCYCYVAVPSFFGLLFLLLFCALVGLVYILPKHLRQVAYTYIDLLSLGRIRREGPSSDEISSSGFRTRIFTYGSDKDGDKTVFKTVVSGPDPGYVTTPISLIVSAETVLENVDGVLMGKGGVYTPGALFADTNIIQKLSKEHIIFSSTTETDNH